MQGRVHNIQSTFAVLKPDLQVDTAQVSPSIYSDLDAKYNLFKGHTLVSAYQFDSDWNTWECHPAGDEVVILMEGHCKVVIRGNNQNITLALNSPGDYAIVPKGLWHTALTQVTTRMLFLTPGEGTLNAPNPE